MEEDRTKQEKENTKTLGYMDLESNLEHIWKLQAGFDSCHDMMVAIDNSDLGYDDLRDVALALEEYSCTLFKTLRYLRYDIARISNELIHQAKSKHEIQADLHNALRYRHN